MSTVKVDTIQTTGGVSEIAIDKLKGVSSANSISIVGEGGTNTTNLQQGLNKAWTTTSVDGTSILDSFNISSLGDTSTGRQAHNVTTNFGNTNYVPVVSLETNNYDQQWVESELTSSWTTYNYDGSAYQDAKFCSTTNGDLA